MTNIIQPYINIYKISQKKKLLNIYTIFLNYFGAPVASDSVLSGFGVKTPVAGSS